MPHEDDAFDPELSGVEEALGSLAPARSLVDRDRLMFRAGQSAGRSPSPAASRLWAALAATASLIAIGEAALLARRPPSQIIERVVVVREPAGPPDGASTPFIPDMTVRSRRSSSAESTPRLTPTAYGQLASRIFRDGLDGLPASPSGAWGNPVTSPLPARQLLQEELQRLLKPGDPS